ncbi:MAG: glycosyltransferase family 4 protein [Pseudorhodobacter sp.]
MTHQTAAQPKPLHIAFFAPMKAPDHPVASGDRLMARLLIRCLEGAGHRVTVASTLRLRLADAHDAAGWATLRQAAATEATRLAALWQATAPPDLWFCYHPYYKSPDLIGPELAGRFGLPYVTCESSFSARRNLGHWAEAQALALASVRQAAVNLCLTQRDAAGLAAAAPEARLAMLAPFIDTAPFDATPAPDGLHLVTVAMMRAGDKLDSFRHLAGALTPLPEGLDWHLSVAGDGPERAAVKALFSDLPEGRVRWLGALDQAGVAALLARGAVYVWPGVNEAYGLAYLEAQAAGLPVAAFHTAGVPEVVAGGLVPDGDRAALAARLAALLRDPARVAREGRIARDHIHRTHSIGAAATRLASVLRDVTGARE